MKVTTWFVNMYCLSEGDVKPCEKAGRHHVYLIDQQQWFILSGDGDRRVHKYNIYIHIVHEDKSMFSSFDPPRLVFSEVVVSVWSELVISDVFNWCWWRSGWWGCFIVLLWRMTTQWTCCELSVSCIHPLSPSQHISYFRTPAVYDHHEELPAFVDRLNHIVDNIVLCIVEDVEARLLESLHVDILFIELVVCVFSFFHRLISTSIHFFMNFVFHVSSFAARDHHLQNNQHHMILNMFHVLGKRMTIHHLQHIQYHITCFMLSIKLL